MKLLSHCLLGLQSSEGTTGVGSASKLTRVAVGSSGFLLVVKDLSSSWHGPFHRLPECVLMSQHLASLRVSDERTPQQKARSCRAGHLLSEMTDHHFCSILVVTQTHPGTMWEGTVQGWECQDVGSLRGIWEAGYHGSYTDTNILYRLDKHTHIHTYVCARMCLVKIEAQRWRSWGEECWHFLRFLIFLD